MLHTCTRFSLLLAVSVFCVAPLAAQAILIDDFNESQLGGSVNFGGTSSSDFPGLPGVVGGTRRAGLSFTGSVAAGNAGADVRLSVDDPGSGTDDILRFWANPPSFSTGTLFYLLDGSNFLCCFGAITAADVIPNGLGSIDLTEGGTHTGFGFVKGNISAPTQVTLTVYDSSANDGTNTAHTFSLSGSGSEVVPFSFFDDSILADAGAITLFVELPDLGNFELHNWETVPEPAPALLLAPLALALIALRRRIG